MPLAPACHNKVTHQLAVPARLKQQHHAQQKKNAMNSGKTHPSRTTMQQQLWEQHSRKMLGLLLIREPALPRQALTCSKPKKQLQEPDT